MFVMSFLLVVVLNGDFKDPLEVPVRTTFGTIEACREMRSELREMLGELFETPDGNHYFVKSVSSCEEA